MRKRKGKICLINLFGLAACIGPLINPPVGYAQIEQFDLDNGIHVILNTIDEATDVGIETIYEVGFIDEPQAMVQSSHLLEHLVCYAPGAEFEQNGAMKWLNSIGMANAETLPDFTHYDYAVPAGDFEKVLQIEAARLQQTGFDPDLIRTEAARVYQETDFVESNPSVGMLKHAMMALSHSWKYQSDTALIRGGLDDMPVDQILAFYQQAYRPDNLTIAITGKVTLGESKKLIAKHFGNIKAKELDSLPELDWDRVPAASEITWDSKHSAVCVAWNPPSDPMQRVYLSLLGTIAMQKMMASKPLKKYFHMTFCSNAMWGVGDMPLFAYGMCKEGQSLQEVTDVLKQTFTKEIVAAVKSGAMFKSLARNYEYQLKPTAWKHMRQQSKMLTQMGRSEAQAIQMSLTQDALTRAQIHRFLGKNSAATIKAIRAVDIADLKSLVADTMQEKNRHSVAIVPK